jgi:hypothetical protein
VRLSGASCSVPYFVSRLAGWIDLERPLTGLHLSDLGNSGHLPERWTTYRYRIVDSYQLNWWGVPGQGKATLLKSWQPEVQAAEAAFLAQVCRKKIAVIRRYTLLTGHSSGYRGTAAVRADSCTYSRICEHGHPSSSHKCLMVFVTLLVGSR